MNNSQIFAFGNTLLDDFVSAATLRAQCTDYWRPTWQDGSISWHTLRDRSIVYCKTEDDSVKDFFHWARSVPSFTFRVITHDSDKPTDESVLSLCPPNVERVFALNNTVAVDVAVVPVPLGLSTTSDITVTAKEIQETNTDQPRRKLLYVNFREGSWYERGPLMQSFLNRGGTWFTIGTENLCKTAQDRNTIGQFLRAMVDHKFILCPRGWGVDTFRLWEALYAKTIPVVRSETAYRNFTDLPILFVKNWNEVTEDFLERKYKEICSKTWDFSKLSASWWGKQFRS